MDHTASDSQLPAQAKLELNGEKTHSEGAEHRAESWQPEAES